MSEDKLRKELASKCGDSFEEELDFFKRHLEKVHIVGDLQYKTQNRRIR